MPHESTRRIVRSSNKQSISTDHHNHKENTENELKLQSSSSISSAKQHHEDSQKVHLKTHKETSIGKTNNSTLYTWIQFLNG
jgi:hypothetical protein